MISHEDTRGTKKQYCVAVGAGANDDTSLSESQRRSPRKERFRFAAMIPFAAVFLAVCLCGLPCLGLAAELDIAPLPAGAATAAVDPGEAVDKQVEPQHVYSSLVAETVRGLLEEVLILGLFIVGVGHAAHAAKAPGYLRSANFRKRLALLAAVMLFVTYMKLTYYVEWTSRVEGALQSAQSVFTDTDRHTAALMVILLTPLDLAIVGLLAGMFLVLARDEYLFRKEDKFDYSLVSEVRQLYLLTGGAHLTTAVWWVAFGAFSGGVIGRWEDLLYHATFAALHGAGYYKIKSVSDDPLGISSPVHRTETAHVSYYIAITIAVYVTRLWIYVFRYTGG